MEQFPEKKLSRLLTLMSELCGLLKKENTLLKKQRQNECKDLLEQKTKLSAAYEESFAYFSKRGDLLKALPEKQKRVLLTRENNETLAEALRANGVEVLELPLIRTVHEAQNEDVEDIMREMGSYDWITFSSANGVKGFFREFFKNFDDIRTLGVARIACVTLCPQCRPRLPWRTPWRNTRRSTTLKFCACRETCRCPTFRKRSTKSIAR